MRKTIVRYLCCLISVSMLLVACNATGSGTEESVSSEMSDFQQSEGNSQDDKEEEEENSQIEYEDTKGYLENDSVFVVGVEKLPYSHKEIYNQLFDIKNRIELDVDITDEELMQIQKDYEKYRDMGSKSPIYREASLNITITTSKDAYTYHIAHIGIRMKGNTSRTSFYSEEEGQYNLIHFRIKFQDGDFATLENLELKWNRNDDSTYIREYYAYEMYRDLGILAPHTNLASTDVGGVHQGVFNIYEPVDKNFIEKYVPKEDQGGDLYKCAWTMSGANLTKKCSIGIEDEDKCEFYNYDLKTNKKTSSHEQMKNLIRVLNSNNVTKEDIAEVVDMDSFLRFAAISYFVGNPDDIRYNYNNHYIYFLKSSGKAVFIPYDCDRVLGVTKGWNPLGNGMADVDPFTNKAEGAYEDQKNPLFRYTVDRGGYYMEEYALQLKMVAASEWLTLDKFADYYDLASKNYFGYTTPDKTDAAKRPMSSATPDAAVTDPGKMMPMFTTAAIPATSKSLPSTMQTGMSRITCTPLPDIFLTMPQILTTGIKLPSANPAQCS